MHYMLLIYDDEAALGSRSDEERAAFTGEYFAFTQALQDAGAFVAGDALQPTGTARSVRVREGDTAFTDGPFAETREQLGGYYLIDVGSDDEAASWASRIPSARTGTIEIRPVVVFEEAAA